MTARNDVLGAAIALTERGQSLFSPADLIAEARRQQSTYLDSTLRTHIVSYMCVNASGQEAGKFPDLVRIARGLYRLAGDRSPEPVPGRAPYQTMRMPVRPRVPRRDRARQNVEALIDNFSHCLQTFEAQQVFGGPSVYFHCKALERRKVAPSAAALLGDQRFLEYLYAVLPAWGMHRMGKQAAKVPDFETFAGALQACVPRIDELWEADVTSLAEDDVDEVGRRLWEIIARLRSSTSDARLVSGSKTLHHVLPALMPPIDRSYTFRFFAGQMMVSNGEEASFRGWWPHLCEIGRRCANDICTAVGRPEALATSRSKIIDNAIIGYRLLERRGQAPAERVRNGPAQP